MKHLTRIIMLTLMLVLFFCFASVLTGVSADYTYSRNAVLVTAKDGRTYPGVYSVSVVKGDKNMTLGIPSLAKQNLTAPTQESPAIIMGAAVPYERLVEPTIYEKLSPSSELYPPYSYFRYEIMEELNPDGTGTHRKMSGFDGTYLIIRVDVSDLIKDAPAGSYLHVRQKGNAALQVYLQHNTSEGVATFSDALGNKTGSYSLDNNAAALKDTTGSYKDTPYLDVILVSSGTLVAGADTGSTDPTQIQADFTLEFYVDQTKQYNDQVYPDPNYTQQAGGPTLDQVMIAKYYDEKTASPVTSYTVKGADVELEAVVDDNVPKTFWSLRQSMTWEPYYGHPIRLICEAPLLDGLSVDGTGKSVRPNVILNVNSFDIQLANNLSKNRASLTVKNATLKLMDDFSTTGSELAIGNNSTLIVHEGGKFVIDKTCQLEVEYDAASTTPTSGTPAETTPSTDLTNGLITIENGGEIENNGVITIEGTEGKPIDPLAPTIRDKKDAVFIVRQGGKLTNNGCLLSYGGLYNMGTITNSGHYNDVIESKDPDKGNFTYHKGIQISWKDDVTQDSVYPGYLYNGQDLNGTISSNAEIVNSGDIVLVPGDIENRGIITNNAGGCIYLCPVEEAIIPISATVSQPTVLEKRVRFGSPIMSNLISYYEATLTNAGTIAAATVEIVNNGRTGKLTTLNPHDSLMSNLILGTYGKMENSGTITLEAINLFNEMTNSGVINNKVVLSNNEALSESLKAGQAVRFIDKAPNKLTEVYNAVLTKDGDTNIWTYAPCTGLTVTPSIQNGTGGGNVTWTVKATTDTPGSDLQYMVNVYQSTTSTLFQSFPLTANLATQITSSVLPQFDGNIVYYFALEDGLEGATDSATVRLTSSEFTPPAAISGLVYNGKEQTLSATGFSYEGKMEYRLGTDGAWAETVPTAKNAGTYRVYYRVAGETQERGYSEATIAKRPVAVSAVDVTSQVGAAKADISFTISGLAAGETTLNGIQISANADPDLNTVGTYPITVTVNGDNPNYNVYHSNGQYTVTAGAFSVTAKDTSGVFGTTTTTNPTYKGYNIQVTAGSGVTVYYSTETALNAQNYKTAGVTSLKNLPASAKEWHTVHYYATNEKGDAVSGSKLVVIEKAEQAAPTGLQVTDEPRKNTGGGRISGLTPRAMEYRSKFNNGTYSTVYYDVLTLIPGTYLVRMIGDDDHYPSPDCELVINEGPLVTVTFDSNGGSPVPSVQIASGDLVPRPQDPTYPEYKFNNWHGNGRIFDFNKPVTWDVTLTAHWLLEYLFTEGMDGNYTWGSGVPLEFRINHTNTQKHDEYDKLSACKVDGKEIRFPSDYQKERGSVIIRLLPAYLETLSTGTHTLRAEFTDGGQAETTFTITMPDSVASLPPTGDNTMHPLLYAGLLILAVAGIYLIYRSRKRYS